MTRHLIKGLLLLTAISLAACEQPVSENQNGNLQTSVAETNQPIVELPKPPLAEAKPITFANGKVLNLVFGQSGQLIISDAAGRPISFTSSNRALLQVDDEGKYFAQFPGMVIVTATAHETSEYLATSATIPVVIAKRSMGDATNQAFTVTPGFNVTALQSPTRLSGNVSEAGYQLLANGEQVHVSENGDWQWSTELAIGANRISLRLENATSYFNAKELDINYFGDLGTDSGQLSFQMNELLWRLDNRQDFLALNSQGTLTAVSDQLQELLPSTAAIQHVVKDGAHYYIAAVDTQSSENTLYKASLTDLQAQILAQGVVDSQTQFTKIMQLKNHRYGAALVFVDRRGGLGVIDKITGDVELIYGDPEQKYQNLTIGDQQAVLQFYDGLRGLNTLVTLDLSPPYESRRAEISSGNGCFAMLDRQYSHAVYNPNDQYYYATLADSLIRFSTQSLCFEQLAHFDELGIGQLPVTGLTLDADNQKLFIANAGRLGVIDLASMTYSVQLDTGTFQHTPLIAPVTASTTNRNGALLFAAGSDSKIVAFDLSTSQIQWEYQADSPVLALLSDGQNEHLYFVTEAGTLAVIEQDSAIVSVLGENLSVQAITLVNGQLFGVDSNSLQRFDVRSGQFIEVQSSFDFKQPKALAYNDESSEFIVQDTVGGSIRFSSLNLATGVTETLYDKDPSNSSHFYGNGMQLDTQLQVATYTYFSTLYQVNWQTGERTKLLEGFPLLGLNPQIDASALLMKDDTLALFSNQKPGFYLINLANEQYFVAR